MARNQGGPEMISASELGQFAYCPEAARLEALGAVPNAAAQRRMAQGIVAHEDWQEWEDAAPARAMSRAFRLLIVGGLLAALAAAVWFFSNR